REGIRLEGHPRAVPQEIHGQDIALVALTERETPTGEPEVMAAVFVGTGSFEQGHFRIHWKHTPAIWDVHDGLWDKLHRVPEDEDPEIAQFFEGCRYYLKLWA